MHLMSNETEIKKYDMELTTSGNVGIRYSHPTPHQFIDGKIKPRGLYTKLRAKLLMAKIGELFIGVIYIVVSRSTNFCEATLLSEFLIAPTRDFL